MYTVAISFKNGTKVAFPAKQFDIDFSRSSSYSTMQKFAYEDSDGNEAPIYLLPNEVAGVVVVPISERGTGQIQIS